MPHSSRADDSAPLAKIRGIPALDIPEVWIKFLLGMVGLAMAFAAALFSTVFRESGHLWATVLLASVALILATIVGLTTVPYLAHRVVAARARDLLHYDVTRAGVIYVLAAVIIGIAALNTGNNLLYIILGTMLAAIIVSGIASATMLRDLELDVRLPEHVFAGRPVLGRIVVRNPRRWMPSFSIRIVPSKRRPRKHWHWEPYTFAVPAKRPADQQWLRLPDRRLCRISEDVSQARIFGETVYFPFIPAERELTADVEMQFQRRGLYRESSFGLATRFPFAFLTKTRTVPLQREIVVYPRVEPADDFFEVLPMITGEFETFVRGRGYDLYRIREYMPEDSARHVDWKATAKSGSLKVREFSREDERKLRIVFDNPPPGKVSPDVYERAVALAASLAWHFAAADTDISYVAPGVAGTDLYHFLAHLALIAPQATESVIDSLRISDDYNVILTSRPHGTIPTALWACSYFIFMHETGLGIRRENSAVQQNGLGPPPTVQGIRPKI